MPPTGTFTISNPENVISVLVLLGVAFITSHLAARVRAQADLASHSARTNAALTGFLRELAELADDASVKRAICGEVARTLKVHTVLLAQGPAGLEVQATDGSAHQLGTLDFAAAQWSLDNAVTTGRGSGTLTASDWVFHPLSHTGHTLAVPGLAREGYGGRVRADQLPLLTSLIDQGALVLERLRLEGEMRDIETMRTRDRLRGALLSSVSHDLRTPLTAVKAAAAELRHDARPRRDNRTGGGAA